ncbi:MAG: hypothetical protein GY797_04180 [Deltaproteobacteria bacterium]|nr:hypothetical protein [Deltaproteobacteria bacterium]
MKQYIELLSMAEQNKLPKIIDDSTNIPLDVFNELVDAGYIKAIESKTLNPKEFGFLDPEITSKGREYLYKLKERVKTQNAKKTISNQNSNWYQKPFGIITLTVISGIIIIFITNFLTKFSPEQTNKITTSTSLPVVILMDSHLPEVVYREETLKNGGSNTDDLSEILDDVLPLENIRREATSLQWHREEAVLLQNPDIVIIHASAFYDQTNIEDSERKFASFLEYMGEKTKTKFLVYSRGFCNKDESYFKNAYTDKFPFLLERIDLLGVCMPNTWKDISIQRELKKRVKLLLEKN